MSARAACRGFTLLELLIVLTLVGLLLLVVPPALTGGGGVALKAAAGEVAAGLKQARNRAIARNQDVAFVLDVNAHRYRIGQDGPPQRLPDDLTLRLYTAGSELVGDAVGAIRFYPDGSSTGGAVTLSAEAREYHVAVDWLTGRVSIAP